jgi:hypothetical protein
MNGYDDRTETCNRQGNLVRVAEIFKVGFVTEDVITTTGNLGVAFGAHNDNGKLGARRDEICYSWDATEGRCTQQSQIAAQVTVLPSASSEVLNPCSMTDNALFTT